MLAAVMMMKRMLYMTNRGVHRIILQRTFIDHRKMQIQISMVQIWTKLSIRIGVFSGLCNFVIYVDLFLIGASPEQTLVAQLVQLRNAMVRYNLNVRFVVLLIVA